MIRLALILIATSLSFCLHAKEEKLEVVLGMIEVPTLSESNGKGDFLLLLNRIEEVSNLKFKLKFGPGQRVRNWFTQTRLMASFRP